MTYRNSDFTIVLALLRGNIFPDDPRPSLFLCMIRNFTLAIFRLIPILGSPALEKRDGLRQRIRMSSRCSTSIDANSNGVWDSCAGFVGTVVCITTAHPSVEVEDRKAPRRPSSRTSDPCSTVHSCVAWYLTVWSVDRFVFISCNSGRSGGITSGSPEH